MKREVVIVEVDVENEVGCDKVKRVESCERADDPDQLTHTHTTHTHGEGRHSQSLDDDVV